MENQNYREEHLIPISVKKSYNVTNEKELTRVRKDCVSFNTKNVAEFKSKGAYLLLDFGKELCGGIRIITNYTRGIADFHIRFGESITEAQAKIGEKNACNDHSPRDFTVGVPSLADLTFGQTGFRFVYMELVSDNPITVQGISAVNRIPIFQNEAEIITNDEQLNQIIKTAAYTVKLCCQNNYIWDGIKRDRLVWSGDLHPEILTVLYMYGDIPNIQNSITFVKDDTEPTKWANWIPSYSAWWIINLCDYCKISGNKAFFEKNADYAARVLSKINSCIGKDGTLNPTDTQMPYFLDWQTFGTDDAIVGTVSLFILAAKHFSEFESNADADEIITKLTPILLNMKPVSKQALAFYYLAGGKIEKLDSLLEKGGAEGFSTFMAYYILKADAAAGGRNMLSIIKEYYGGMLSKGATTFWEDFDINWMKNSNEIDRFPDAHEKDIHGDFGRFCYQNFRHSLCHGWSAGVLAFIIEYILGIKAENGEIVDIKPNLVGLTDVRAVMPIGNRTLQLEIDGETVNYSYK